MISIYDKKYQIFISSTFTDLVKARGEVIKAILSIYQIPIGMEMFSADNEEQWNVITSTISDSDYYVLIIGHRYGSTTKEGISYTEKEFDFAKSIGLPILAFVRRRDIPTVPTQRESEPDKNSKLELLIEKVTSNAMVDFWETEDQLAQKVTTALVKIFTKNPRIGWIKSDRAASPQVAEEFVTLHKENRELKKELDALNLLVESKKPSFEVLVNGADNLVVSMPVFPTSKFGYISPISPNEIPAHLNEFITNDQIEKFNNAIRRNREIADIYNEEFVLNNRKKDLMKLDISIKNIGSVKATDIIIDLKFPVEVYVTENENETDGSNLVWPRVLPKHPLVEADLAFKRIQNGKRYIGNPYPIFNSKLLSTVQALNKESWVNIVEKENKITLGVKKILHTRTFVFANEIFFAPLKKGTFEIQGTIICEEIERAIDISFPILIEEDD